MAYNTNHLRVTSSTPGPVPFKEWIYDTVDSLADIYAAGYISDAKKKGMLKGDLVKVRRWTTAVPTQTSQLLSADGADNDLVSMTLHWVIGMSAAGAADLTDGLAITATNT